MIKRFILLTLVLALCCSQASFAQSRKSKTLRTFEVNGVEREALVHIPKGSKRKAVPIVFIFHGHGGTAKGVSSLYRMQNIWKKAIVVYPEGLNTPVAGFDPEGKYSGWEARLKNGESRDLDFFDVMLEEIGKEQAIDPLRIHATGFSHGGYFTYFLWEERGEILASLAPAAASMPARVVRSGKLPPRPILHIGSTSDTLVQWAWQDETIRALREQHECSPGIPWKKHRDCIAYLSEEKAPVYTYLHKGGHTFSSAAPKHIAAFFQKYPLPEKPKDKASDDSQDKSKLIVRRTVLVH